MCRSHRFAVVTGLSCPRRIVLGRIVLLPIVMSGLAGAPSLAFAANIYWDGLGTTWNSTTDWSTASNATTPHPAAVPGGADIANFNISTLNTTQTVTLDAVQSALGLGFTSAGTVTINNGTGTNTLTIGTSGITVAGGAGADTINANVILGGAEIWTNNSANALSVSGNISNGSNALTIAGSGTTNLTGILGNGSGGLIMSGSGTRHLTNNNSFTGGLTINSGEVQLAFGATGALNSTTPNTVTFGPGSTGTLTLNADSVTIGGLSSNGGTPVVQDTTTVSLGATLTIGNAGSNSFDGVLQNGGPGVLTLVKSGIGSQTLSGNNTFTGGLTVQNGTLTLSGNNTFSGGLVVSAGILAIPSINNVGSSGTLGSNTSVTLGSSGLTGTLEYTGTAAASSNMPFVLAPGGAGRFQVDNNNSSVGLTLSGVISGSGALTVSGNAASLLTLIGNNTFSGGLTIQRGNLAIPTINNANTNGPLGNNSSVNLGGVPPFGALEYTGASASSNMPFVLVGTGGEFFIPTAATDLTLSGVISGGELELNGPGTLTLTGNNTFTGDMAIVQATLRVATIADSGNSNLANSGALGINGGTLEVTGGGNVTSREVVISVVQSVSPTIQIDGGNSLTLNGQVHNPFSQSTTLNVVMPSGGTLTFGGSADNSALDLNVESGTVILAEASSGTAHAIEGIAGVSPGATVQLAGTGGDQIYDGVQVGVRNMNGTLDFNGRNEGFAYLYGTGTVLNNGAGTSTMSIGTGGVTSVFSGTIADNNNGGGGMMALLKVGAAVVELSGNNTFTGGVTINAGTLFLGNPGALNSTAPNAVVFGPNSTGTLEINGFSVTVSGLNTNPMPGTPAVQNGNVAPATLTVNTSGSNTFAGSLQDGAGSAALSLTKTGAGALTLSGNNTATGPININGGTLAESGGGLAADVHNQAAFVYIAGTFSGRLFNAGAVTFNAPFTAGNGMENDAGLTIGAGQSITLDGLGLDNEGSLTMAGGTLTLSTSGSAANVNHGTFNLSASLPFNLNGATLANGGALNLNGGTISGTTGLLSNAPGGVISGPGTITSPFNNAGGLLAITANNVNISQAFANSGDIQLTSGLTGTASLVGGAITNANMIQGAGSVGNGIANNGTVQALGGTLFLNGALSNPAGGLLTAGTGNQLLVTAGLATNAGVINLTGGTFDNGGHLLNNTGQISGWGIFRTGGTGLDNNGSITFSGGLTTVNGSVTNENAKTITIAQNPAIFTGLVINNVGGTFNAVNTTATFAGGFTNNGNSNFVKAGNGVVEVDVAPTLNNGSSLSVSTGTLRFNVVSGNPNIGTGVTATVSSGATLELAGTVSALAANANRVNIKNNSTSTGVLVSGTNQQVGNIDGSGTVVVNAGSDLIANHIIQGALVIGGTKGSPALVMIDASDASGNPLAAPSGFALAGSLTSSDPFGAGGIGSANLSSVATGPDMAALSAGTSAVSGNPSTVPEPSTLLLMLLAASSVVGQRVAQRRHFRRNEF